MVVHRVLTTATVKLLVLNRKVLELWIPVFLEHGCNCRLKPTKRDAYIT